MEIKGTVTQVYPETSGTSANGFTWRQVDFKVVQYIDPIDHKESGMVLTVRNSKIDELKIHKGMRGVFKFASTISEWKERAFNNIACYAVQVEGQEVVQPQEQPMTAANGEAKGAVQNTAQAPAGEPKSADAQVAAAEEGTGLPF